MKSGELVFFHMGRLSAIEEILEDVRANRIVDQCDAAVRLEELYRTEKRKANSFARTLEEKEAVA